MAPDNAVISVQQSLRTMKPSSSSRWLSSLPWLSLCISQHSYRNLGSRPEGPTCFQEGKEYSAVELKSKTIWSEDDKGSTYSKQRRRRSDESLKPQPIKSSLNKVAVLCQCTQFAQGQSRCACSNIRSLIKNWELLQIFPVSQTWFPSLT